MARNLFHSRYSRRSVVVLPFFAITPEGDMDRIFSLDCCILEYMVDFLTTRWGFPDFPSPPTHRLARGNGPVLGQDNAPSFVNYATTRCGEVNADNPRRTIPQSRSAKIESQGSITHAQGPTPTESAPTAAARRGTSGRRDVARRR